MVMRNGIVKSDGNGEPVSPRRRPRKFLFNIGDYNVAVKKKPSYEKGCNFIYVQIWHEKTRAGYIDLTTTFTDAKTVMSVHTMLNQEYQGLGIAYRVYEGLVNETNISLTSDNQSRGAVKLWKRFAKNRSLRLYHVHSYGRELFDSSIYPVALNEGKNELELIDYRDNTRSPYREYGNLMLVRKRSPLDVSVQKHIAYHKKILDVSNRFKNHDQFKLI